jgi:hypothetical protein
MEISGCKEMVCLEKLMRKLKNYGRGKEKSNLSRILGASKQA